MSKIKFQVKEAEAGKRLDCFLTKKISSLSRSAIQKLIKENKVLVNGKNCASSYLVKAGNEIEVDLTQPSKKSKPISIDLEIIYKDRDIL
ncbi:MAG: S4 domain-containing protein, partial [Minisyncoccia bacterium]